MGKEAEVKCTFCGKSNDNVVEMIATPKAAICDECVMKCMKLLVYGEPEPTVINLGDNDEPETQSEEGC